MQKKKKMTTLAEKILQKRPTLSANSVKAYVSSISNLMKKMDVSDVDFLGTHTKEVLACVHSDKYTSNGARNTIIAALLVLFPDADAYKEEMKVIAAVNREKKEAGIMSEKQEKNNLTHEDLLEKFKELEHDAIIMWKSKLYLNPKHAAGLLQRYQQYIILVLTSGIYFPPRRSEDWCYMVFRGPNYDSNKFNQMKKDKFVFNVFKTGAHYGQQEVLIPAEVKSILSRWLKMIPQGVNTLLYNEKKLPLTSVSLSRRINKIFGRAISTTALRHTFLTKKFGADIADIKEKQAIQDGIMKDMGSSSLSLPLYVLHKKGEKL